MIPKKGRWVAISGYKGAGKDTAAQFFVDKGFTKISFADNLKQLCSSVFELDMSNFTDPYKKEVPFNVPQQIDMVHMIRIQEWANKTHDFKIDFNKHLLKALMSPRMVMQYVGTEILRDAYINYHIEATIPLMTQHQYMVCCDVRFKNELDAIKTGAEQSNKLFMGIYVERPGFNGDGHSSETSISESDLPIKIINDTSRENLRFAVDIFTIT